MKIAPLYHALTKVAWAEPVIVHTGQHYDKNMSDVFFEDLGMPEPDVHLGVGGGTHAQQTAGVMVKFEELCLAEKPDLVLVVGDVNSTIACGLVAVKLGIKLVHVEAGLRSGDRTMPMKMVMKPLDGSDEFTMVKWDKIDFTINLQKSFFSIQNLKSF